MSLPPTKRGTRNRADAASFDEMFRAAATRVLRRRGVRGDMIETEIERLRHVEPSFRLPSPSALKRRRSRAARG